MAKLCRLTKELRTRKIFSSYILASVGVYALGLFAITFEGRAQQIENGVGVVCDSPQQIEQMITLASDSKSAVAEINSQNKSRVCEILDIAFLVGGIIAEASNDKGTWQIRKILIVGMIVGSITTPVQPYPKSARPRAPSGGRDPQTMPVTALAHRRRGCAALMVLRVL